MKLKITAFALLLVLAAGCTFIQASFSFKEKTQTFVDALLKGDYDRCLSQMALESDWAKGTDLRMLRLGLDSFRNQLLHRFGNQLEYTFIKSEKRLSTSARKRTPPKTTLAFVEFSNGNDVGVLQVLFDDTSGKILTINNLGVKVPKPNMGLFWLFGLLPLAVLGFNLYVLWQLKRSSFQKKGLKYLAVFLFNVPTIAYAAVGGFTLKLLHIQFLFGVGCNLAGYLYSAWSFGIPLGGMYWLWKLKQHRKAVALDAEIAISYLGRNLEKERPEGSDNG